MTSLTQLSSNCMHERTKSRFEVIVTLGRNKNLDEIKKHSRTSPDVQFNEFSLNKKLDLERTESIRKTP